MLGEDEENDDTSLGLRGPTSVAVWPWAHSHSNCSFSICKLEGLESVVAMELLGFSGPQGILGGSEPLPSLLSLPLALHNEPEAGKGSYGLVGASPRFLNHEEPCACPNMSALFFWASLGRQLCGPRKAGLLLCRGSRSYSLKWFEFPSSNGKNEENHEIHSSNFLRKGNRPAHLQRK